MTAVNDAPVLSLNNVNGSLDTTFGGTGLATTDFGSVLADVNCLAIQDDGKIVVAGNAGNDFVVARYTSSGVLDTTFGTGGVVTTDIRSTVLAESLAIQDDGKIVVAGEVNGDFVTRTLQH